MGFLPGAFVACADGRSLIGAMFVMQLPYGLHRNKVLAGATSGVEFGAPGYKVSRGERAVPPRLPFIAYLAAAIMGGSGESP